MKIAIRIDTGAAIRAGVNAAGVQVLEFDPADLTQPERDMLAAKAPESTRGQDFAGAKADIYLVYGPGPIILTAPTLECLRAEALGGGIEARRLDAVAAEECKAKQVASDAETDARLSTAPASALLQTSWVGSEWYCIPEIDNAERFPLTFARRADVIAERDRLNAERSAKIEEDKATAKAKSDAEQAKKVAGTAILAEWVAANGSELVRERKENGFAWVALAEQEYTAYLREPLANWQLLDTPEGFEESDSDDREHPTLAEIRALKAAREAMGKNAEVDLAWSKYTPTTDEDADGYDEEREEIGRAELVVRTTSPLGREFVTLYSPDQCSVATVK